MDSEDTHIDSTADHNSAYPRRATPGAERWATLKHFRWIEKRNADHSWQKSFYCRATLPSSTGSRRSDHRCTSPACVRVQRRCGH